MFHGSFPTLTARLLALDHGASKAKFRVIVEEICSIALRQNASWLIQLAVFSGKPHA
jgi:hypothetical protein